MKIYIDYENQEEENTSNLDIKPILDNKKVVSVTISVKGQPEIILGKPYQYQQEIIDMMKVISNQNFQFDKLKKDYEYLKNNSKE